MQSRPNLVLVMLFCALAGCSERTANSLQPTAHSEWVKFQDPYERAFTLDAPQGWTVKGGLFRLGYSDARLMVDLISGDGKTNIRLGDVSIPSYVSPSQLHSTEGSRYDLGAQAQMIVARYRSGPEFAVLYSHARFHGICQNPQPDQTESELSVHDYLPLDPAAQQSSAGQIFYRCDSSGGPRVVFAYARTSRAGTPIWQANVLVSFTTPPDHVDAVRKMVTHILQSFQLSPEWIQHQAQMDAEGLQYQRARQQQRQAAIGQQVQQFEAKMQSMQAQVNSFERRQNAQAAQVQGFDNALVGITPTVDPLTGESRQVWTGTQSGYWVNGQGQVVNSNNAPGAGWRQLQTQ